MVEEEAGVVEEELRPEQIHYRWVSLGRFAFLVLLVAWMYREQWALEGGHC